MDNIGVETCYLIVIIHIRYLGKNCTSMAIVEVELPTGYKACDRRINDADDPLCLKDVGHTHLFVDV